MVLKKNTPSDFMTINPNPNCFKTITKPTARGENTHYFPTLSVLLKAQ
jgi:hypothetical protein